MDVNKLKKLRDIDYKINPSCGTCIHSYITVETDWGICKKHSYNHAKHTTAQRDLSIHRSGSFFEHPNVDLGRNGNPFYTAWRVDSAASLWEGFGWDYADRYGCRHRNYCG